MTAGSAPSPSLLHLLATLYVAMAQSDAAELTPAELEAVIDTLHGRHLNLPRAEVQNVVMETLTAHLQADSLSGAAVEAVRILGEHLSPRLKQAVLGDLEQVALSDGVVLSGERALFEALVDVWNVAVPWLKAMTTGTAEPQAEAWSALHDLAYLYLALAHGTDSDFSGHERQVMLRTLQEWMPAAPPERIEAILEVALARYAVGVSDDDLRQAAEAVRDALPKAQRKAALHDLVQIANADGVFLDSEEDFINELMTVWNVEPYASYGGHGSKA